MSIFLLFFIEKYQFWRTFFVKLVWHKKIFPQIMFFYPIKQMLFYLTESSNELKIIVPKKDFTFLSNWKTRRKCHRKVQDNSPKRRSTTHSTTCWHPWIVGQKWLFGHRRRKEHSSESFCLPFEKMRSGGNTDKVRCRDS